MFIVSQSEKIHLQYGVRSDTLLARVKGCLPLQPLLLDIGRSDKVIYSYSRSVTDCRKHFGSKGYCRAFVFIFGLKVGKTYTGLLQSC